MDIDKAILRSKQNDREAFAEVFDHFVDRIYRFIKYKISDQLAAEDILQEVFLKAWLGLPKLPEQDLNFSAWLYKIAGNTVNDYFRKQYRTPSMLSLESVAEVPDVQNAQDILNNSLDTSSDIASLKKAFNRLPVQYKQVLEIRYIQDFTLEETAKMLGKTNLAVRLLQHRALKKLRQIIQQTHDI